MFMAISTYVAREQQNFYYSLGNGSQ